MTPVASSRPVVLIAVSEEHSLASVIDDAEYAPVEVHIGSVAIAQARDLHPDVIIVDAELPDMSGIDACRSLQGDPRIARSVPIVILAPAKPTPEQRAAATRAGAWGFLLYPGEGNSDDLPSTLQTYVHAKRNMDLALAEGLIDPITGVHSRGALARRVRELGALMSREHGALACVMFELTLDPGGPDARNLVARVIRVCDIVGAWSATEIALVAPATGHAGAVKVAQRVAVGLGMVTEGGQLTAESTLRAGYDAVTNFTYSPIDPVELLARAAAAVRSGTPETNAPWVRRFEGSRPGGRDSDPSRTGPLPEKGRFGL